MRIICIVSAFILMSQFSICILEVNAPGSRKVGNYALVSNRDKITSAYVRLTHEKVRVESHRWVRELEKDLRAKFFDVPESRYTQGPDDCHLTIERPFTVHEPYVVLSTKNCNQHTVFYTNPAIVDALGKKLICEADALQRSEKLYDILNLFLCVFSIIGLVYSCIYLCRKKPPQDGNAIYI